MEDKQGLTPLEYVRDDVADEWITFLDTRKDELFPIDRRPVLPVEELRQGPIPDPPNALQPEMAEAVAAGRIPVETAIHFVDLAETKFSFTG